MTNVIEVFNEEQINEKLNKDFKDWTFDGKWIRKTYKTHSWKGTLMLVNAIGHLSEIAWHHPDLIVATICDKQVGSTIRCQSGRTGETRICPSGVGRARDVSSRAS